MRDLGERAEHAAHHRALADHGTVADQFVAARAMQARHAMGMLERVEQFAERKRRAHVVHAVVAYQPAHAFVLQHARRRDRHPHHVQVLQALLELRQLGIAVFRLEIEHTGHRRAAPHHPAKVPDLLDVANLPARAELGRIKSIGFVARYDQHLCGACRRLAQSVHNVLPDIEHLDFSGLLRGSALTRALYAVKPSRLGGIPHAQRRHHGLD